MHRSSSLDLNTHISRLFGTSCPDVASMSAVDVAGIQAARPFVGMSRQGTIIALGYPPEHRTPSVTDPVWTYWGDEGVVQVHFTGDAMTQVTGEPDEPAVLSAGSHAELAQQGQQVQNPGHQTGTGQGNQQQHHQQQQQQQQHSGEMITVRDSTGYPIRVPSSAVGAPCGQTSDCYSGLTCTPQGCSGFAP